MEKPTVPNFGAVTLEGTLSTLAQSKKVQERLSDEWDTEKLESILEMMRTGELEGALGDEIHDFFVDEIENEGQEAWRGLLRGEDSCPVDIMKYEGVYFVRALEMDSVGYFLDIKDAQSYVTFNSAGEVQEDVDLK